MISGGDGKLRINLLSWDFFRNIFMRLRLMYFGVVVMNCIQDIDGQNGKLGGKYYLQALVLKSRIYDFSII